MKRNLISALAIGVLLVSLSGMALAQIRDPDLAGQRLGPPDFGVLGGADLTCSDPNLAFGASPETVSDVISISGAGGSVSGLEVTLQIEHTWVGDIIAELEHNASGTTALLIEQIGVPGISACGCDGDDIDAVLSDAGASSVEDECAAAVPSIAGILSPFPDSLSTFDSLDPNSDWTLTITDGFPASDDGTFLSWCINIAAGGGGVPATGTWGIIALIALFMGVSMFYLRRRVKANS